MATLIYDADCGFCTTSASWLAKKNTFDMQAWQLIDDLEALGLDYEKVTTAAQWMVDGKIVASGADSIAQALLTHGGALKALGRVILFAPVRPVARFVYGKIAVNRHRMPGGTAACKI